MWNEILASDGVEKAAGGPTSNDGQAAHPGQYAPAADVCQWAGLEGKGRVTSTCMPDGIVEWMWTAFNADASENEKCPNCGKPISFKETP
jgi:hypothetical protein